MLCYWNVDIVCKYTKRNTKACFESQLQLADVFENLFKESKEGDCTIGKKKVKILLETCYKRQTKLNKAVINHSLCGVEVKTVKDTRLVIWGSGFESYLTVHQKEVKLNP